MPDPRIAQLNDRAVTQLIEAHRARTDEPLVLAIRYDDDGPSEDIHLLEVLAEFPGPEDDEPLTTEFDPSATLRIFGKLHLSLCSPAQLLAAVERGDSLVPKLQAGRVVFDRKDDLARGLKVALDL